MRSLWNTAWIVLAIVFLSYNLDRIVDGSASSFHYIMVGIWAVILILRIFSAIVEEG